MYHSGGSLLLNRRHFGLQVLAIVAIILICFVAVRTHWQTQAELLEKEKIQNQCLQKQEAVSAQLQVVYEHKSRLEKALNKAKEETEALKDKLNSEKNRLDTAFSKQKTNLEKSYDAQRQQLGLLQTQYEDLQQQHASLQSQLNQLKDEKLQLENKQREEAGKLQSDATLLESQIAQLRQEVARSKNENDALLAQNEQLRLQASKVQSKAPATSAVLPELQRVQRETNAAIDTHSPSWSLQSLHPQPSSTLLPSLRQLVIAPSLSVAANAGETKDVLHHVSIEEAPNGGNQIVVPKPDGGVGIVPNREQEIEPVVQVMKPKLNPEDALHPPRQEDNNGAAGADQPIADRLEEGEQENNDAAVDRDEKEEKEYENKE